MVITGNEVHLPAAHGITLVTDSHCNVTGNVVRDPGNSGILVQSGNDLHLRGNYVRAPGRAANATHYGIRLSTSATSISLSGNKIRPNGSAPEAIAAFSATNTCTLVHRYGNDWRGTGWTTAALDDQSTTPNTSATDLIA